MTLDASLNDWTPEEEKKLVRRIDLHIFPMLCFVFALSLLDRTNISSAYIAGLEEDLGLNIGSRYSIALLVFFIGYAVFELPSNFIIRKVGARLWLSFLIIVWGAIVLAMGFVHSWITLTVCRALLGIFEAGLFPGSIFIIGAWYRQWETARRVSLFYMSSLLASGFGPILAYLLSLIRVGPEGGMYTRGWRWIFIIEGAVTVGAGILAIFTLGDFPENAKWLSNRERDIALRRVRVDESKKAVVHPTMKQTLMMCLDWKLLIYSLQYFVAASSVYSLSFFKSIILMQQLGFDYTKAQLLGTPPYIFAIICSLIMAWVSDKYRIRWPVLVFQGLVAITGLLILLLVQTSPYVQYFGMFLAVFGTQANIPGTLAYGQSQTPRAEKKGVVSAVMITMGAAGGVCGSTIFRSQDKPRYLPGMLATIGMISVYIVATFCMSMYFKRQNRLADEGKRPALEGVEGFRYAV